MSDRNSISGIIEKFVGLLQMVVGTLLIFMVILNAITAFGRFTIGTSITGADEILIFSMIWLVFLGAAIATWRRRHLSIDLLRPRLPSVYRRILGTTHGVLLTLVCVFVAFQSSTVIGLMSDIGQRSMGAEIPMTFPHAAVITGLGLAALFAAVQCIGIGVKEGERKPAGTTEKGT